MASIEGTAGPDVLAGAAESDSIRGGGGNDTLRGGGGYDRLYGEAGDDQLRGGTRADFLYGGEGNDTLAGDDGGDALYPGPGADAIDAGDGNDFVFLIGGEGPDTLAGGPGGQDFLTFDAAGLAVAQHVDLATGNLSDGSVWQGFERLSFFGGSGDDSARGGAGADYLHGGEGDDLLRGRAASDNLFGGEGDDSLFGGEGRDILGGDQGADRLAGGAGDDVFHLYRGEGADTLRGGAGTDSARMTGWSAAEFRIDTRADGSTHLTDINLADGDDGVFVFRSIEWVYFSDASVQLGGDDSGDEPLERPGEGIDTVRASVDWTLGPNLEILDLSGDAGNDTLSGAGGADGFLFDTALAGNTDTISDFTLGEDSLQLDNDIFGAFDPGMLDTSSLAVGAMIDTAQYADDRIVYDKHSGTLYYDADGQGGVAAVAFARLGGVPALVAADFLIVD